uniref:gametocyte-specific factor 1 n=1 Tax=Doryrhamphus excisus TaxID=161450 RepID=UPI0025AE91C5|nr:gametocyte-specific factor 1 [Doryrhamphus excisus]XP_057907052.1 gametocyte-specific factor 1 [Doryrhamphus excisus]XP_057907053.1 gametocyte-specific factor 1 [Doryrhamphus excisus]XP_057907054.1 gametocyte-specific factor 1 [Doryrhamphus excisus]XP_057907055.1 gametocyte-specific factor 1 [Doryrhamphus excisus]
MMAIRFESSTGPCRSVERTVQEESDEKGNFDPDKLCQCPFDKNHQIRACRLAYHILKCKKNHPELAKQLRTCPFNACHLVPRDQVASHTDTCPDKISMGTENGGVEKSRKWEVPVTSQIATDMTEDWEKEIDDAAVPFIWGDDTQGSEAKMTNSVASKFRLPTSLPW